MLHARFTRCCAYLLEHFKFCANGFWGKHASQLHDPLKDVLQSLNNDNIINNIDGAASIHAQSLINN